MENRQVEEVRQLIVGTADDELRLDIFLTEQTEYSRSFLQKLIKQNRISVDDNPVKKAGQPLRAGQTIRLELPACEEPQIRPEPMELNIVYEDESVYNYLRVEDTEDETVLSTNVLFGVQSIKRKNSDLTGLYAGI